MTVVTSRALISEEGRAPEPRETGCKNHAIKKVFQTENSLQSEESFHAPRPKQKGGPNASRARGEIWLRFLLRRTLASLAAGAVERE